MTIEQMVEGYKLKKFSPVDIAKNYLNRVEKFNNKYNAYITVTEEEFLKQALVTERKIMSGDDLSVLEGIPISFKDNIDTKAIRTTCGSKVYEGRIPKENAHVVKKLRSVGSLSIGKTNMYEFGFGITSENPFYGSIKNPWNTNLIAGGSSGGSAVAVLLDLCMGSIGTDTAGSIRVPSSCCGVVGLKPTHKLVKMDGIMPVSWSLDHVGPIARNVSDLSFILEGLVGKPYNKYCKEDIKGLRIGVPTDYFNERNDPVVNEIYLKTVETFEKLGAILVKVNVPYASESVEVAHIIATSEVGYAHKDLMNSINLYGEGAEETFRKSYSTSAFQYISALKKRELMQEKISEIFEYVDIIITPTIPVEPIKTELNQKKLENPPLDIGDNLIRYTCLFDVTGHPALTIPCGLSNSGIPIGMQLIANKYKEGVLIQSGYAYETNALNDFMVKRDQLTN